jgi:penicillin-binding protein 1A
VRNFGNPAHHTVFPYDEAYEGTSVLKQVITQAGATGTSANYGCPAAGKTGTAENLANAWFVGYTPRMSTAVWVGNPHGNIPMINGFGGVLAAPIWRDYMHPASGAYCGDWNPPTTPFEGTAFFGPHASTGAPSTIPTSPSSQSAPSTAPTGGGGVGTGTSTSSSSATTPAPPTKTNPGGGNGGGGNGGGGNGGGNGNGNGSGGAGAGGHSPKH